MIGIKNGSGQKLKARYDGNDYTFEADEKVVTPLSEDAAAHIFGYGLADKSRALLRLGWVQGGANMEEALERLGKFSFLAVEDIKFKDGDAETTLHLPRKVAGDAQGAGAPLSKEEQAVASKLAKPEQDKQQFATKK